VTGTSPIRFAVLGAGAIGAYVGAALARGGADVTLIARGAHLQAMQRDGVRVLSPRNDFTAHPRATDDIASVSDAEVVFVALKAYSVPEIASRLGKLLAPDAAVIWAQNGVPWWYFQSLADAPALTGLESVDPGGVIANSIDPRHNVGCVVYCSAEIVEPGVIRHVEGTRFTIGEPDGADSERCRDISVAFSAGGLRAPVESGRLRDQIWLKLVGNVAFNPISALTGATMAELGSVPEVLDLVRAIFAESAAVAARLGVTFPISLDRRLEAALAVGDHKTSMLQDLEAGKRLEYECMTGAVVELAGHLHVDVPHTAAVHACVKLLDQQRAARRASAG
jgi:2-dehydropantoate 2-reductase